MKQEALIDNLIDARQELLSYATRLMGSTQDGEDLLGDLIVSMLQRGDNAGEIVFPMAFFKTCLRNTAVNKRKREQRITPIDPADDKWIFLAKQRDDNMDTDLFELMMWLDAQLQKCPPEIAEAFRRYYLDGYPLRALAQQIGIPPNTLAQRFRRIRMDIKRKYPEMWTTLMMLMKG